MLMAASPPASDGKDPFDPIVVMGVCGCGKSLVAARLSHLLNCRFLEGDSLHPPANVGKMRIGLALDDDDRWPWLDALGQELGAAGDIVISCSALKRAYRDRLRRLAGRPVTFVFLRGERALLTARMAERTDHYMPLSLLDSQLAALEPPVAEADVISIDINQPLEAIVDMAMTCMSARRAGTEQTDRYVEDTMSKPEILMTGPYPDWDLVDLEERYVVHKLYEAADREAFLDRNGATVRAIATRGELGASADLIGKLPKLEIVSVYGVGYDAVDLAACRARGIRVTNTPDVLTNDVADLGVAMMLCLSRGMIGAERWVQDGSWAAKGLYPLKRRIWGRKAGVLGLGRIGFEVAKRLKGFDMDIAYSDVSAKPYADGMTFIADPVALADYADFLFVTLAASDVTRHIVSSDVIAALGPDGMLINISRASNIDEEALLAALETGLLGSAALDVFEGEPKLNPRFLALDNVLLQPHHASGTIETRKAMGKLVRDNLAAHFAGASLLTAVV
ncbi:carbohydrate kinase, thermoresistant glucokinase family [Rhizobium sp. PDO1-076]|nr:carbohydrate kinase, thermoresistant glucokinase family [Rhizobium sp. PDO1-076]